jgi:acetyl-CoA acetyltransferase
MRDAVAIAGVGHTAYGKLPGRSPWSLQAEAVSKALDDAGLTRQDLDGLCTESHFSEPLMMHGVQLGRMLGLRPRFLSTQSQGGATCASLVQTAAMAIANGLCDVAAVVYGDNAKTGMPNVHGLAQMGRGLADDVAHGMAGGPVMESRAAMRYMHETGCTHEMLGAVAVSTREHAAHNPHAQYREAMTMDDYLASRFVAEPLRVFDCTIVSDGGACMVLTSARRARDCAKHPVLVSGFGQAHNLDGLRDRTHYTSFAGARSSNDAYAMAGISPDDADVAQLYDCFTSTVLVTLEDYGFCGRGEAGPLALDGGLTLDGKIPTNTSGGMLSEANVAGWNHVIEAVRQLRGESSSQVPGAEVAVVSGHGGFQQTHATLVLRRA